MTDSIEMEIRRWLPCSADPDRCQPDGLVGDVYADPDNAVTRHVNLDAELRVVIRPIGHTVDNVWTDSPSIEGDGLALALLLRRLDAAVTTFAAPAFAAGSPHFAAVGSADPTFPYGVGQDGWALGYRGPEGTHLTTGFSLVSGTDLPAPMYGWWSTLEIVDGTPILYLWAGQIAG